MMRCSELALGAAARVARIDLEPQVACHLASLGIVPGAPIVVLQRWPSYLVRCEETEVALEESVAGRIVVRKHPSWNTPRQR